MAINKESTGFTLGFASVMVIIVGVVLTTAAVVLKEPQDKNVKEEKMQNILASVNVEVERTAAPAKFNDYVKERIILDKDGNVVSTTTGDIDKFNKEDAFNVDVKKQDRQLTASAIAPEEAKYPLYRCEVEGKSYYVVPMAGKGLWGPVWGFLSFQEDMNTVYGATFDHKTETPGLGAEIKEKLFQTPFIGQQIFNEKGEFVSIRVVKGGANADSRHEVDGITGGTITSDGVDLMLSATLKIYEPYFKSNKS